MLRELRTPVPCFAFPSSSCDCGVMCCPGSGLLLTGFSFQLPVHQQFFLAKTASQQTCRVILAPHATCTFYFLSVKQLQRNHVILKAGLPDASVLVDFLKAGLGPRVKEAPLRRSASTEGVVRRYCACEHRGCLCVHGRQHLGALLWYLGVWAVVLLEERVCVY